MIFDLHPVKRFMVGVDNKYRRAYIQKGNGVKLWIKY